MGALLVDAGHREELLAVPGLVAQVLDLPGVVEEQVVGAGVGEHGVELELVGDIRFRVAVVVDVNLVQHVVAELVEVRPAGGLLEGHVIGDDGNVVRTVRAHERVQVRAVCDWVLGYFWSFAVGGHRLHLTVGLDCWSGIGGIEWSGLPVPHARSAEADHWMFGLAPKLVAGRFWCEGGALCQPASRTRRATSAGSRRTTSRVPTIR